MKKNLFILIFLFSFRFLFSQTLQVTANPSNICLGFASTLHVFGAINTPTWSSSSTLIQFSSTNSYSTLVTCSTIGTYTIFCSAQSGTNIVQTQTNVRVIQGLNIGVAANTLTTCIENNAFKLSKPVVLSASGANTYSWFPYSPSGWFPLPLQVTVRPSATTCYTVLGSTSTCSGTAVICVTVIPQFTMNVVPSNPTICVGDQIGLEIQNIGVSAVGPTSAFTYSWTDPQTISMNPAAGLSQSVTIFPNSNATYTVEVKDAKGCASLPQLINVTVEKCTTINEFERVSSFVYPNPFQNSLTFQNISNEFVGIELINLQGNSIIRMDNLELQGEIQINVETLEQGLYFLKIKATNGKVVTLKVIKD